MNQTISYLTLAHGIAAGMCATLAITHLVLIVRSDDRREKWMFLSSTLMAAAAGAAIIFELFKVLAPDVDAYLRGLEGEVLSAYVMITALAVFFRFYFNARADRLLWFAIAVWTISHIYIVMTFPEGFFSEIQGLTQNQTSWGEPYVKLDASVAAPKYFADIGSALVLIYIALVSVTAWQRGDRRRAAIVGGASFGFLLVAGILVPLDDEGLLRATMPIGAPFLAIVGAFTYQLIDDRVRANRFRLEIEQLRRATLAGEIAAGLVHELNQPLTAILSNAQAARRMLDSDNPDIPEVLDAIDDVVAEDKRAAGIIHGLRNLLRRGPVEVKTIDINPTIRRVAGMLAGAFNTSSTTLELNLTPAPAKVSAGEVQIEQVLLNLLLNALRALSEQPPTRRAVEISSVIRDGVVEVSVADNGPGIDDSIVSRLFEPFTSGGDGLGMGLAICRRIISLYDGTILAENRDDGGARFIFTLPVAD